MVKIMVNKLALKRMMQSWYSPTTWINMTTTPVQMITNWIWTGNRRTETVIALTVLRVPERTDHRDQ
jgi:hypothetical protein